MMTRFAALVALLAAGWSPAAHCFAMERAAKVSVSCHSEQPPAPAEPSSSDCAVMACCQAALLPAAVTPAPSDQSVIILAPAAFGAIVASERPVRFESGAPPGPPRLDLAVSRLGRAPPVA